MWLAFNFCGILGLFTLAACQPSKADDKASIQKADVSQIHPDCKEMPTTSDQDNCDAQYTADEAGVRVEHEYQVLLKRMDAPDREWARAHGHANTDEPTYKEALSGSQDAWVKYRNAQCLIEMYERRGGTGYGARYGECAERLNRERLAQLREMQREF